MTTLAELERRLTRVERRRIAATAPSRWAAPCALPPPSVPALREVLKALIESGVGWVEITAQGQPVWMWAAYTQADELEEKGSADVSG